MAAQQGSQGMFGGASPGGNRGGTFGSDVPSIGEIREFDNKVSGLVARKGDLMRRIRRATGVLGGLSTDHL